MREYTFRVLVRSALPVIIFIAVFVSSAPSPAARAAVTSPLLQKVSADPPQQSDPTIVRSRYIAIRTDVLPTPSSGSQQPIVLDLFDDVSVVAVFDRFDPNLHGITWVGHVEGSEGSTVTLVYSTDGEVQGSVITLQGTYTIGPAPKEVRASMPQPAGLVHVVAEIDMSKRRRIAPPVSGTVPGGDRGVSRANASGTAQLAADTGAYIDVLVVYTPSAASSAGGATAMRNRIELLVSQTNTSYANSGVTQRIRLSHVAQVPYADATYDLSHFADLENLRTGAPGLEGVAALRNQYSADVVALIARNDDFFASCGNAYLMDTVGPAFEAMAFSVTDFWCTSVPHTFAEMLGQNMGLRYEWFLDNGVTPYTYAHGHVQYTGATRFYTLMATYELCNMAGVSCQSPLRWSNPSQTLSGVPLGVPAGTRSNCSVGASDANTCDADSAQVLNNTAPIVANFRQSPATAPGAFSKIAPADQGSASYFTTLSWESAPFVESYEYCYDTTNNNACDGSWIPINALSAQIDGLLFGTTYYWQVRALNAYGPTLANGGTWWRFTLPPAFFSKIGPGDRAYVGQVNGLVLTWEAAFGATSYEYCYDTTVDTTCNGSWIPTSQTGAIVNGLSPATVYSWQVRAISSGGTTLADYGWWRFNTSPSYLVSTLAGLPGVSGAADGTGGNARFVNPTGVALDSAGTLYVTERHRVRKITPLGVVTTLAGASTSGNTDASGTAARFNSPWDVAVDNAGVVYVADSSNHTIRKITPAGVVTTLAGLAGVSGTTDATGTAARFNNPRGIVVDGAGTVYVADFSNHTIRKITAAGEVTTLAGLAANPGTANGSGSTARFNFPQGMGIDNAGFLYVADVGSGRIRKISPAGDVTTLGINFAPGDIAVDSAGMVYVADTNFHMIWQITPAGVLTTIAGLSGTQGSTDGPEHLAKFGGPTGIAVDSNTGTLYIADRNNHTVRRRGPVINGPNLVNNGDFSAGTTSWQSFALPDSSYMSSAVVNGVFEFTKSAPPPGGASQATIFQNTGQSLPARASLQAQFALGNNSSVRKRISVLVLDSDFSDLSVCTFWLPANLPLTTYGIRTYTTKAWTNASIYFYAATDGANGGAYQVDNVGLWVQTGGPVQATTCIDPLTPAASLDAPGPTMLVNGDFGSGALSPWGVFGTITYQIGSGVFEFIRPNNTLPAGVVFQATNQAVAANQVLTSTFQLGNSSLVRKRVTVILHDSDFSDLSACTFWLAPQQQMSTYEVRTYATKPWANAMISFYPATTDTQQWIRLDAATLKRTPGMTNTGTRCIEPGGS